MERHNQNKERYTTDWFRKRAIESIAPLQPHNWDYSDSLLLYIHGSDESYESLQQEENLYHKMVTAPEHEYLASIAESVADALPDRFEYIDLGPGTEHKEQYLFDVLKKQGKEFIYRPVDISKRFLALASEHAQKQSIASDPIYASFEELPETLADSDVPRFVSIGLTYSNYDPKFALEMLKRIAGERGSALINSQIRDRIDMEALTAVYASEARDLVTGKLSLLDLGSEAITGTRTDSGIRTWCTLGTVSDALKAKGVEKGDDMLIFQSLRPTKESLESDVKRVYPNASFLDTGASFIGVHLKP